MDEEHWTLLASHLSGNTGQEQQDILYKWLETKEENWRIFTDAALIWGTAEAKTLHFNSRQALQQFNLKKHFQE